MKRVDWDALTGEERRQWALDHGLGLTCIAGCGEPAGTPWGLHWCAAHDAERLDRIRASLNEIADSFPKTEGPPLRCPRCGEDTPGNPNPETPEYSVELCDSCVEQMLDEDAPDHG